MNKKMTMAALFCAASMATGSLNAGDGREFVAASRTKEFRYRLTATWQSPAPVGRSVTLGYESRGNGALTLALSQVNYQLDRISDDGFSRQSSEPRRVSIRVESAKTDVLVLYQLQACREVFAQASPFDSNTQLTVEFSSPRRLPLERAANLSLDTESLTIHGLSCSGEYMD